MAWRGMASGEIAWGMASRWMGVGVNEDIVRAPGVHVLFFLTPQADTIAGRPAA